MRVLVLNDIEEVSQLFPEFKKEEVSKKNKENNILFCDFMLFWLEKRKNKIQKNTYESYPCHIKNRIYPYFKEKEIQLCDLTSDDISDYRTPFLDFREPLRSYRFNLMYNVNRYIDRYKAAQTEEDRLVAYGRAERYAKVLSESIVDNVDTEHTSDASQYFKETAKGLLTGIILLVSEYGGDDERHIISVFRLIIEMNGLDEGAAT